MSVDFYLVKPGRGRRRWVDPKDAGVAPEKVKDFSMGHFDYLAARYRLFSLTNPRFGLVWVAHATSQANCNISLYDIDTQMDAKKELPKAMFPVFSHGDCDGALTFKQVAALRACIGGLLSSQHVPNYRIAMTNKQTSGYGPSDTYANFDESGGWRNSLNSGLDVNSGRACAAFRKYKNVVEEASRLGMGLGW